jgi:hypothetical protein
MSSVRLQIDGAINANSIKKEIQGKLTTPLKRVIFERMSDFLYEDVRPLVPKERYPEVNKATGTSMELVTNSKITITKDSKNEFEIIVHFGSDDVSKQYAFKQHDRDEFQHEIGTSKFLSDPFQEMYPILMSDIKMEIRRNL